MAEPKSDQHDETRQRVVLLATDNGSSIIGEVADGTPNTIVYSAYGEQSSAQPIATNLGFQGQLRESNIGWYLLGNGYRAYNPRLMRFHSPDSWSPFGGGGLNAYMYCGGEPVMNSDPTGHAFVILDDLFRLIGAKVQAGIQRNVAKAAIPQKVLGAVSELQPKTVQTLIASASETLTAKISILPTQFESATKGLANLKNSIELPRAQINPQWNLIATNRLSVNGSVHSESPVARIRQLLFSKTDATGIRATPPPPPPVPRPHAPLTRT